MSSSLTLIWEEKSFHETLTSTFDFRKNFNVPDSDMLFCGKFDPPVKDDLDFVETVHFSNIIFLDMDYTIILEPTDRIFRIKNQNVTLKITEPIFQSMPEDLNSLYDSPKQLFYVQLFYRSLDGSMSYMRLLHAPWDQLLPAIESVLNQSGRGRFGVKIGVAKSGAELEMIPALDFFNGEKSWKYKYRIIIMAVSSNHTYMLKYLGRVIDTSAVPTAPKDLLYRIASHMRETEDDEVAQISRKAMVCCANGGIPLHSLDRLNMKLTSDANSELLNSKSFESIALNLRLPPDLNSIEDEFIDIIASFKRHLSVDSSESSLRSLFWDQLINRFFYIESGGSAEGPLKYRLSSEWLTRSLFPALENETVDFVTLVKFGLDKSEIPILCIEVQAETFDFGVNTHKDFSKLLGILSKTCIKLAYDLEADGKRAEDARAYGLWIGGSQFQFCVAHAVLNYVNDGEGERYEIQANVSFYDHWKFDLLGHDSIVSCNEPCCSAFSETSCELEKTIPTESSYCVVPVQDIRGESEIEIDEEFSATDSECGSNQTPQVTKPSSTPLYADYLNIDALKKLRIYIKQVVNYINIINHDFNSRNGPPRNFVKMTSAGVFTGSRKSSFNESSDPSVSEFPTRKVTKKSKSEYAIHLKLAPFSQFFPRIFNIVRDEESEQIVYEFEEMSPFIDYYGNMTLLNYEGRDSSFAQRVFDSLRFSLHCAYGLYILHKIVGVVHSDISPLNIMYSEIDHVWKIIDFDRSAMISDSKTRSRVAGTKGYVLPASLESGIFTEESDIYSLGKVLYNLIYFTLLGEYVDEFDSKNPLTLDARNVFLHFENIVLRRMTHSNPERIIKIETLLKDLVVLIERLKPFAKIKYEHDPVFSAAKLLLEDLKEEESSEKALESGLIKKPRISTESNE